jgi:hypothetical protein
MREVPAERRADMDINDVISSTEPVVRVTVGDAIDTMLDELRDAVDGESGNGDTYAEESIDTDDEEGTWSASEVYDFLVEAWDAGFDAAKNALTDAIDSARYRG